MRRAHREVLGLSRRKPRFTEGHSLGDFIPVLCANVLPLWAMWMFDWSLGRFLICFWFELACIVVVVSALVGGAVAVRMLMASAAFLAVSLACVVALALDPQDRDVFTQTGLNQGSWPLAQLLPTLGGIALSYSIEWYRERKIQRNRHWESIAVDAVMLHLLASAFGLIVVSIGAASFPVPALLPLLLATIKALIEVRWVFVRQRLSMGMQG